MCACNQCKQNIKYSNLTWLGLRFYENQYRTGQSQQNNDKSCTAISLSNFNQRFNDFMHEMSSRENHKSLIAIHQ